MVEPNAPATSSGLVLDGKFHEGPFRPFSGWLLAPVSVALLGGAVLLVVTAARHSGPLPGLLAVPCGILFLLSLCGYFIVNPNESRALVLFGHYRGTEIGRAHV